MTRIAGLASGTGRSLLHVHDFAPDDVSMAVAVTDTEGAGLLDAAAARGIPTEVVDPAADGELRDVLGEYAPDVACLEGFDGPLDPSVIGAVPLVLDGHRSLLPAFPGEDPIGDAIDAGVRLTGVTITARTPDGDAPIVTQEPVPVVEGDDRETLEERLDGRGAIKAYSRAVDWAAEGRISVDGGRVTIDRDDAGAFPARRITSDDHVRGLRYGENPHQGAAVFTDTSVTEANVVAARNLNPDAKALSYNNYNDADAALNLVKEFDRPAAAVIKHTNPAGCAVADRIVDAYDRALRTDPMSAFGGIVALNRECDVATAEAVTESFKEVVVAPTYTDAAIGVLRGKENLRILETGGLGERTARHSEKPIVGGRLVQDRDLQALDVDDLEVVTEREPTDEQRRTMVFAWRTIKHVKSNAILFATGTETVGIGMGQVSRVDAVRIAAMKAADHAEGKSAAGAVMASDAFFPFPDGIEVAADAGIEAVVQPGGSVNDDDVIDAADDHDVAMAFTGMRCFRHD